MQGGVQGMLGAKMPSPQQCVQQHESVTCTLFFCACCRDTWPSPPPHTLVQEPAGAGRGGADGRGAGAAGRGSLRWRHAHPGPQLLHQVPRGCGGGGRIAVMCAGGTGLHRLQPLSRLQTCIPPLLTHTARLNDLGLKLMRAGLTPPPPTPQPPHKHTCTHVEKHEPRHRPAASPAG